MTHPELIFIYSVRYESNFIFFIYEHLIVTTPSDEKTILYTLNCLCIFVKIQLSIHLYAYVCILLQPYLSVLTAMPHCLDQKSANDSPWDSSFLRK